MFMHIFLYIILAFKLKVGEKDISGMEEMQQNSELHLKRLAKVWPAKQSYCSYSFSFTPMSSKYILV